MEEPFGRHARTGLGQGSSTGCQDRLLDPLSVAWQQCARVEDHGVTLDTAEHGDGRPAQGAREVLGALAAAQDDRVGLELEAGHRASADGSPGGFDANLEADCDQVFQPLGEIAGAGLDEGDGLEECTQDLLFLMKNTNTITNLP